MKTFLFSGCFSSFFSYERSFSDVIIASTFHYLCLFDISELVQCLFFLGSICTTFFLYKSLVSKFLEKGVTTVIVSDHLLSSVSLIVFLIISSSFFVDFNFLFCWSEFQSSQRCGSFKSTEYRWSSEWNELVYFQDQVVDYSWRVELCRIFFFRFRLIQLIEFELIPFFCDYILFVILLFMWLFVTFETKINLFPPETETSPPNRIRQMQVK